MPATSLTLLQRFSRALANSRAYQYVSFLSQFVYLRLIVFISQGRHPSWWNYSGVCSIHQLHLGCGDANRGRLLHYGWVTFSIKECFRWINKHGSVPFQAEFKRPALDFHFRLAFLSAYLNLTSLQISSVITSSIHLKSYNSFIQNSAEARFYSCRWRRKGFHPWCGRRSWKTCYREELKLLLTIQQRGFHHPWWHGAVSSISEGSQGCLRLD